MDWTTKRRYDPSISPAESPLRVCRGVRQFCWRAASIINNTFVQKSQSAGLSNNKRMGEVLMDMATCSSLQLLDLQVNLLKGKLSRAFFSSFPLVYHVSFVNNYFDGDVPKNVSRVFHVEGSCFYGIPLKRTDCSYPHHGWIKKSILTTSLVVIVLVGLAAIVGGLALRLRMQKQLQQDHQQHE